MEGAVMWSFDVVMNNFLNKWFTDDLGHIDADVTSLQWDCLWKLILICYIMLLRYSKCHKISQNLSACFELHHTAETDDTDL